MTEPLTPPSDNTIPVPQSAPAKTKLEAKADSLVAMPPVPKSPGWWQRSAAQRFLRWLVGISHDNEQGAKFMHEVLQAQVNTAKTFQMHKRVIELQGKGINGVAAYAQEIERMVRFLGHHDDRLRKAIGLWDEKIRRERELAAEVGDSKLIESAGTENVHQAVKDLEPKIEVIPINKIRKPSDN